MKYFKLNALKFMTSSAIVAVAGAASADQVFNDDVIITGSLCVGFDCVNGESFGFDTIRLKENNLRIKFQDTSNSASFPSRDWQITVNDSSNGGANKFSIDDIDGGRTPFTIEAGAPTNSLYVDDGGRLGLGTATPVVDIHALSGNTPTLRLQQDGSSGFASQTFDVAANETNFFIRDATNGSTLPFRIRPGAPTSAIDIAADGDVGLGTSSPDAPLDIVVSENLDNTQGHIVVNNTNATAGNRRMMHLTNNGGAFFLLENRDRNVRWAFVNANSSDSFLINDPDSANLEFELTQAGDLKIEGNFVSNGTTLNVPDYVFADEYDLMPLAQVSAFLKENRHLPKIPSAKDIAENGVNHSEMQMALLEKIEELTLYTLEQQESIDDLHSQVEALSR